MGSDRFSDLIAYVRDLEARDEDVAMRIEATDRLLRRVDDVRTRAKRIRRALDAIPDEIERAVGAVVEAQARESEAQRDADEAAQKLAALKGSRRAGEDARAAAERAARRTRLLAVDAAEGVVRQTERLRLLRSDRVALGAEAEGLAVEARTIAKDVAQIPRISESGRKAPGSSLEEIEDWGARAHSAIFVVRGGLDTERERLVNEAGALAAATLGEQVSGASVALVRRRLEEEVNGPR